MTRSKSIAIGSAVLLAVVSATVAFALNAGFVAAETDSSAAGAAVPVTSTTSYEQYLEAYYSTTTTTGAPTETRPETTTAPEPIVVYEYVDVPVTVPPPRVVEVPAPATATPATAPPPTSAAPPTTALPVTTNPPTTAPPVATTSQPPERGEPEHGGSAPVEILAFDLYGFAEITVADQGPGEQLRFQAIEQDAPWVWEIEQDRGSRVEVKFFNTDNGKEATFVLRYDDGGRRLKTEGDGFPEREERV